MKHTASSFHLLAMSTEALSEGNYWATHWRADRHTNKQLIYFRPICSRSALHLRSSFDTQGRKLKRGRSLLCSQYHTNAKTEGGVNNT